jgi:hypothetical protein
MENMYACACVCVANNTRMFTENKQIIIMMEDFMNEINGKYLAER